MTGPDNPRAPNQSYVLPDAGVALMGRWWWGGQLREVA